MKKFKNIKSPIRAHMVDTDDLVDAREAFRVIYKESQPSTIGEANQRRHGRKTGSACGRYRPIEQGAID
nr:unnamed protein product [Spirometra erinaceieuropaei]